MAIIKKTPAIAIGPKTGPSLIDNQAQPLTHKKMNIIIVAAAAMPNHATRMPLSPVFACTHRTIPCCRLLSICNSEATREQSFYSG
jgi:hypothetical protein